MYHRKESATYQLKTREQLESERELEREIRKAEIKITVGLAVYLVGLAVALLS